MKKLLAIGLLGLLSMGNIFPDVPTQSIFGEDPVNPVHTIQPIDQEKTDSIKSLFSTNNDVYNFYEALLALHSNQKFDKRNILALILQYQDRKLDPITTFDKSALIEFLKYYKNLRAQEIIDLVKDSSRNARFGDTKIEDNVISTALAYITFCIPEVYTHSKINMVDESILSPLAFAEIKGMLQGVFLTIGTYNLFKIVRYYWNIRRREREMRRIDRVIATIETFK